MNSFLHSKTDSSKGREVLAVGGGGGGRRGGVTRERQDGKGQVCLGPGGCSGRPGDPILPCPVGLQGHFSDRHTEAWGGYPPPKVTHAGLVLR